MRIEGIAWSTEEFTVRGKEWHFTKDDLLTIAPQMIDKPVTAGHRGPIIGKIIESWIEDNVIKYRAVIFEPRNEIEKEYVKNIKKGNISGVSPSFTYPIQVKESKPQILHGDLEILEKNEEGTLIKIKIPIEEIKNKFGSEISIDQIEFGRIWLHNGSSETKEEIVKIVKK